MQVEAEAEAEAETEIATNNSNNSNTAIITVQLLEEQVRKMKILETQIRVTQGCIRRYKNHLPVAFVNNG